MKNKKMFIILILYLVFLSAVVLFVIFNKKARDLKNVEYFDGICLSQGYVCDDEQILDGILISYQVNDKKDYDFYVIDNDEDTLTLIMNKNLVSDVNWHEEFINMKGPLTALLTLQEYTQDWLRIPVIEDYVYVDYGKKYDQDKCIGESDDWYDCNYEKNPYRGYDKVVINDQNSFVDLNIGDEEDAMQEFPLDDLSFRARLITLEEVTKLKNAKWLASNLKDNEAYWTLSSAPTPLTTYSSGAFAVVKGEETANLEGLYVINTYNEVYKKVGLRPVITINKPPVK